MEKIIRTVKYPNEYPVGRQNKKFFYPSPTPSFLPSRSPHSFVAENREGTLCKKYTHGSWL